MQQVNFFDNFHEEPYNSIFRINPSLTQPQTIDFFEFLYNSPTNIKIKWNAADELNEDSHLKGNYGVIKHNLPFLDYFEHFTFKSKDQKAIQPTYKITDFVQNYKDKIITSNFYTKKTMPILESLKNIPVYVILNGRGEIVVANSFNKFDNKETTLSFANNLYGFLW